MDFETQMLLVYSIFDECVKIYTIKDDFQCKMSTAEVMTMSIASAQFFYGNFRKSKVDS